MNNFTVSPIGTIYADRGEYKILLHEAYIPALTGIEGFSHLQLIWWFSHCDGGDARSRLSMPAPYRHAPATLGTFATRSPMRPNPLALSVVEVLSVDAEKGEIQLAYTDAEDGTPLLDIKPYTPSVDRVESPGVPTWCAHWPKSYEASGSFNWEAEFTE